MIVREGEEREETAFPSVHAVASVCMHTPAISCCQGTVFECFGKFFPENENTDLLCAAHIW